MRRLTILCAMAVGLVMSAPLAAHHTGSTLLSEKPVTLKGTVKTWLWSNPHCLLTIDVTGADGTVVQWVVETQAPNSIYPDGYRSNSFKAGDAVTVTLQPAANGLPYGRLAHVVLPDGSTLGSLPGERGRGRGADPQ